MSNKDTRSDLQLWLQRVVDATGLRPSALARRAGVAPSTLLRALDQDNPVIPSTRTLMRISTAAGVMLPDLSLPFRAVTPSEPRRSAAVELSVVDTRTEFLPDYFAFDRLKTCQFILKVETPALNLAGVIPGDYVVVDSEVKPVRNDIVCADVISGFGMGIVGGILGSVQRTRFQSQLEQMEAKDQKRQDYDLMQSSSGSRRSVESTGPRGPTAPVPGGKSRFQADAALAQPSKPPRMSYRRGLGGIQDNDISWSPVIRVYEPPYLIAKSLDPSIAVKPILMDANVTRLAGTVIGLLRNAREASSTATDEVTGADDAL